MYKRQAEEATIVVIGLGLFLLFCVALFIKGPRYQGKTHKIVVVGAIVSVLFVGLPVTTVDEPELCAVKGLQKIILDKEYYKKLTYSMLDEDYRWLR